MSFSNNIIIKDSSSKLNDYTAAAIESCPVLSVKPALIQNAFDFAEKLKQLNLEFEAMANEPMVDGSTPASKGSLQPSSLQQRASIIQLNVKQNGINGAQITIDNPEKQNGINGAQFTIDNPEKQNGINGAQITLANPEKKNGINGAQITLANPEKKNGINGAQFTIDNPEKQNGINGAQITIANPEKKNGINGAQFNVHNPAKQISGAQFTIANPEKPIANSEKPNGVINGAQFNVKNPAKQISGAQFTIANPEKPNGVQAQAENINQFNPNNSNIIPDGIPNRVDMQMTVDPAYQPAPPAHVSLRIVTAGGIYVEADMSHAQRREMGACLQRSKEEIAPLFARRFGLAEDEFNPADLRVSYDFDYQTVTILHNGQLYKHDLLDLKAQSPAFRQSMEDYEDLVRGVYYSKPGSRRFIFSPQIGSKGNAHGGKPLIAQNYQTTKYGTFSAAGNQALAFHSAAADSLAPAAQADPRRKAHEDKLLKVLISSEMMYTSLYQQIKTKRDECQAAVNNANTLPVGAPVGASLAQNAELAAWQRALRELEELDKLALMSNAAAIPENITPASVAQAARQLTNQFKPVYRADYEAEKNKNVKTWMPKIVPSFIRGKEENVRYDEQYLGDFGALSLAVLDPAEARQPTAELARENGVYVKAEGIEDFSLRAAHRLANNENQVAQAYSPWVTSLPNIINAQLSGIVANSVGVVRGQVDDYFTRIAAAAPAEQPAGDAVAPVVPTLTERWTDAHADQVLFPPAS